MRKGREEKTKENNQDTKGNPSSQTLISERPRQSEN